MTDVTLASSVPVYGAPGATIRISGLITCIGVVAEKIHPVTTDVTAVVAGHFVTPTMYFADIESGGHGSLTNEGRLFLDQIKHLMADNDMSFGNNTELVCYYAPRLDGVMHRETQGAMKPIEDYMGARAHECTSTSTFDIRIPGTQRQRALESMHRNYRCDDPNCAMRLEDLEMPVLFRQDASLTSRDVEFACGMCGKKATIPVYI